MVSRLCDGYNYWWNRAGGCGLRSRRRVYQGALRLRAVNCVVPVMFRPVGAGRGAACYGFRPGRFDPAPCSVRPV